MVSPGNVQRKRFQRKKKVITKVKTKVKIFEQPEETYKNKR